jgi:SAM-dependent methyltransferase
MASPDDALASITPGYENRLPAHQNALDILSGSWTSSFPAWSGLVGGSAAGFFEDLRVPAAVALLGTLSGRSILELGPYEGYNTYQFQQAGAVSVISIESNRINFIKCLIIKNIFGLNATFLHGDFLTYLQETPCRFDVCWASGVLYHMTRPIELIKAIRRVSDTLFLWTCYYDNAHIPSCQNPECFDASNDLTHSEFSRVFRLHYRSYAPNQSKSLFYAGGGAPHSYWMEKEDIIFILHALGYQRIDLISDYPDYPAGPSFCLLARV